MGGFGGVACIGQSFGQPQFQPDPLLAGYRPQLERPAQEAGGMIERQRIGRLLSRAAIVETGAFRLAGSLEVSGNGLDRKSVV